MATTSIESWAVDLKDVGAIYPFQGSEVLMVGSEVLMVIVGVALWIAWHFWCVRWERSQHEEKIRKFGNQESMSKALDAD